MSIILVWNDYYHKGGNGGFYLYLESSILSECKVAGHGMTNEDK
jgi:hypothetical protein